jgi:ribonucleoside-triphosphate reductase
MNSIGGSDLNIGSFKVLTVNLPQIALLANGNKEKYFEILKHRLDIAIDVLSVIRDIIQERIQQNFLPLYKYGFMNLDRQYGTVGFTGMYEAAAFMGLTEETITGVKYTKEGEEFVDEVLDTIREYLELGYERHGFTYNTEQVPAEKAAVTLAKKDRELFGERQVFELYSNQWLPLIASSDPLDRIKYSGRWDRKVSGGAILHINIQSPFRNEEDYLNFVKMVANNGVIYFAFNQKISVCTNQHAFAGERCPICGGNKTDEYFRIVGYLVPKSAYNKVRRDYEYDKRVFYNV